MKLIFLFIFLLAAQSGLTGASIAVGRYHPLMSVWPFLTFFFICAMIYCFQDRRFWEGKLQAIKDIDEQLKARSRKG